MVNKFEHERGHELGVKKNWKKRGAHLQMAFSVDEGINPF
jgi:hypothetical protein